jgi:hypothetical protein
MAIKSSIMVNPLIGFLKILSTLFPFGFDEVILTIEEFNEDIKNFANYVPKVFYF